jgi:hypothetical protein
LAYRAKELFHGTIAAQAVMLFRGNWAAFNVLDSAFANVSSHAERG